MGPHKHESDFCTRSACQVLRAVGLMVPLVPRGGCTDRWMKDIWQSPGLGSYDHGAINSHVQICANRLSLRDVPTSGAAGLLWGTSRAAPPQH